MTARFAAVGLAVRDLAASVAFYRRLGLQFAEGAEDSEHGHVEAQLPGGLRLMLDTVDVIRSFDPEWSEPTGSPRASVAFELSTPGEVDRLYGELVDAGYHGHKQPWDAFWGQRYAIVHDPDGNGIDLFAPLEAA